MSKTVITVETVRAGQPRAYADSFFEYNITVEGGAAEFMAKQLATKVLRPCSQTKAEWQANTGDAGKYFSGYYEFKKTGDNTFNYLKVEPFTD